MARNYPTIATTHTITLQGKTVTDLFDLRVYFDVQGIIALYESNELSSFCYDVGAIVEYRAIERIKSLGPLTYVEIISKLCRVFSIERTPMENQSELTVEQLEHDVRVIAARNRQSHVFHQKQANIHATELTLNAQLDLCTTKDEHESIAPIIAKALDTTSQETNINVPGIAPSQLLPLEPVFTPQYAIASSPNKRMNFEQKSSFTIQRQRMTPIYPNQQIKALSNDENPYESSKQQSRKTAQSEAVTYGLNLAHNREKKLSYSQKKVTTFTYRNKVKQGINHALTSNSTNNGATKRKTGAIQPISMYPGVNKSFYKTSTLGLKDLLFVQIFEYKGATTSYKYDLCAWHTKISPTATQNEPQVTTTTNYDGALAELCPDELMLALDTPSLYFCANKSKLEEPHTNTNHEVAFLVKLKPSKYFDHYHLLFVGEHDYFCFTLNQDRNDLINTICSQDPSIYQICSLFNLSEYFDTFECFEDFDYESLQTYFRFKSFSSHQRSRYARTYKFDHIFTKDLPPSHYPRYAQFYIEEHTSSPGRSQGHGHSPAAAATSTTTAATATAATTASAATNNTPSYGDRSSMDDRGCVSSSKRAINLNENRVLEHNSTTQIARSLKGNYSTSSTSPDLGATVDALSYIHETTNASQDDFLSPYQSDKQGNFYLNPQTSTFSKSQEQDQSSLKANLEPELLQACSPSSKYHQSHAHHQDIAPYDAYCPNNSPESGMEDNFTPNTSDLALKLETDHSSEPLKTDLAKTASTISSDSELYNNDDGTEVSFTPNSQDLELELEADHTSVPLKKDLAKTASTVSSDSELYNDYDGVEEGFTPNSQDLEPDLELESDHYREPLKKDLAKTASTVSSDSELYNNDDGVEVSFTPNNQDLELELELEAAHSSEALKKDLTKTASTVSSNSELYNNEDGVEVNFTPNNQDLEPDLELELETNHSSGPLKKDLAKTSKSSSFANESQNELLSKSISDTCRVLVLPSKKGLNLLVDVAVPKHLSCPNNIFYYQPTGFEFSEDYQALYSPIYNENILYTENNNKHHKLERPSIEKKQLDACHFPKKTTKSKAKKLKDIDSSTLVNSINKVPAGAFGHTLFNSLIDKSDLTSQVKELPNPLKSTNDQPAKVNTESIETLPKQGMLFDFATFIDECSDLALNEMSVEPIAGTKASPIAKSKSKAKVKASKKDACKQTSNGSKSPNSCNKKKPTKDTANKQEPALSTKVEALKVAANKETEPNSTIESAQDTALTSTTANKVPSIKDKVESLEVDTNKVTAPNSTTESAQDTALTSTTANKVPSSKDKIEALEVADNTVVLSGKSKENAHDTALTSTKADKVSSSKDNVVALEVATNKESVPNSTIESAKDTDLPSTTGNTTVLTVCHADKVPSRKDKVEALEVTANKLIAPNITTEIAKDADLPSTTGNTTILTVCHADKVPSRKDKNEALEVATNKETAPNSTIEIAQDADLPSTKANKVLSIKDKNDALEVATNQVTAPNITIESAKDTDLPSTKANNVPSRKDKVEALEVAANKLIAPNITTEIAKDAELPSTTGKDTALTSTKANKVPSIKDKVEALEVAAKKVIAPNSTTETAKDTTLTSTTANKVSYSKDKVEALDIATNTGSANIQESVKNSINKPVQNQTSQSLDRKKITSDFDRPQFNNTWKDIKGAKHIPSYLGFFNEEQIKQSNLNTTMDKMAQSYREAYEQFSSNNEGVSLNTKHSRTTVLHSHKMNRLGVKLFED